jgi:FkbM family methyltransferase
MESPSSPSSPIIRPAYAAMAAVWLGTVLAMVYFTGAVRLPTAFAGEQRTAPRMAQRADGSLHECVLPVGKLKGDALAMAESHCADDQSIFFANGKSGFWGAPGFERMMDTLFSEWGNAAFFGGVQGGVGWGERAVPEDAGGPPITLVHVGSHLGHMLDRYKDMRRGPRLDDRIVMAEPNPVNHERLARRIRLDPRLSLRKAAVSNEPGRAWFMYSGVPNVLGNGGHIDDSLPVTNATDSSAEGYVAEVVTLDQLLAPYDRVDFIYMDPEGFEPRIFLGAKETLAKTNMLVFGCSQKWVAHAKYTTNKRTFKLLADNGFTVLMLGKERNLVLNDPVGPERAVDRLQAWGFCAAVRTTPSPPTAANLTALASLVAGVSQGSPLRGPEAPICLRYLAATMYNSCKKAHGTVVTGPGHPLMMRGGGTAQAAEAIGEAAIETGGKAVAPVIRTGQEAKVATAAGLV